MGREWKYILWPDFGREQLFHLAADPAEERDLVDNPAQAVRLEEMRERFRKLAAAAK